MKTVLKVLAGFFLFVVFVLKPLKANLLATVATHFPLVTESKVVLLETAIESEPCNVDILNDLGDAYNSVKNPIMASFSYGRAMICSHGNSVMRFKYGATLVNMGFDGTPNLREAINLEPNNPVYNFEYEKVTKLLSQSR